MLLVFRRYGGRSLLLNRSWSPPPRRSCARGCSMATSPTPVMIFRSVSACCEQPGVGRVHPSRARAARSTPRLRLQWSGPASADSLTQNLVQRFARPWRCNRRSVNFLDGGMLLGEKVFLQNTSRQAYRIFQPRNVHDFRSCLRGVIPNRIVRRV